MELKEFKIEGKIKPKKTPDLEIKNEGNIVNKDIELQEEKKFILPDINGKWSPVKKTSTFRRTSEPDKITFLDYALLENDKSEMQKKLLVDKSSFKNSEEPKSLKTILDKDNNIIDKFVPYDQFLENKKEAIEKCQSSSWLDTIPTNDAMKYINWVKVHQWMKKFYPSNKFFVTDISPKNFVKGKLLIEGWNMGELSLSLNLKVVTNKKTGDKFEKQETPEQLQMRVYVKLVANITGFGLHLWHEK